MTATLDKIGIAELSSWVTEGPVVREYNSVGRVVGIETTSAMYAQILSALVAAGYHGSQLPNEPWWAPHPNYSSSLFLLGVQILRFDTPTSAFISLRYVNNTPQIISGGAGLETVQTDLDVLGVKVKVTCVGSSQHYIPPDQQEQTGVLSVLAPTASLVVRRFHPAKAYQVSQANAMDAEEIANKITGAVNSQPNWHGGPTPVARSWLCESMSYSSQGLGTIGWDVTYTFRRKIGRIAGGALVGLWDPEVIYIDRETGEPHPDAVPPNGRKQVMWPPAVDFFQETGI